jgi:hypothetical protein
LEPIDGFVPNPAPLDAEDGFTFGTGLDSRGSALPPDDASDGSDDDGDGIDDEGSGIDVLGTGGTIVAPALFKDGPPMAS